MRDVVADARAKVVANGAGCCLLRIRGAHGVAPFCDGAFRLEDHGENFSGAHEVRQFPEEWPLAMHGVEAAGFVFSQTHGPNRDDAETTFMNARKNFTLKTAANRVRLDNRKSPLESQNHSSKKKESRRQDACVTSMLLLLWNLSPPEFLRSGFRPRSSLRTCLSQCPARR